MVNYETLGSYRILRKLGQGGMAVVYLAEQTSVQRQVAIKVLPREFADDPQFQARFEREGRLISALEHPRILPVHDFGEDNGVSYIVMRYLDGGSLADRIEAHPEGMPLDEALRLAELMAEGIDFAHSKGIIHRDFKPGNVFFDPQGNPYIADFGLAKATFESMRLTGKGGVLGTPHFMAPELTDRDSELSPAADVYAYCVTLFLMLTGSYPYDARKPIDLLLMHVNLPVPDITRRRRDLPEDLRDVMFWGMAKKPEQRAPSAGALAARLREALSGAVASQNRIVSENSSPATIRAVPTTAAPIPQAPRKAASRAPQTIFELSGLDKVNSEQWRRILTGVLIAALLGIIIFLVLR